MTSAQTQVRTTDQDKTKSNIKIKIWTKFNFMTIFGVAVDLIVSNYSESPGLSFELLIPNQIFMILG